MLDNHLDFAAFVIAPFICRKMLDQRFCMHHLVCGYVKIVEPVFMPQTVESVLLPPPVTI